MSEMSPVPRLTMEYSMRSRFCPGGTVAAASCTHCRTVSRFCRPAVTTCADLSTSERNR